MREFIYFSNSAVTSGNFGKDDLMSAGRMDIAIHTMIAAFFLSHKTREDVIMHLVFYGMPDPPKHIEIHSDKIDLSKKDVAGFLRKILYKYKPGVKNEVVPGVFIEKKSLLKLVDQLQEQGKNIFVLDMKGEDIRKAKIDENSVFLLGDQDGFPQKELKRLKLECNPVSIGNKTYFASHTLAIVQNEIDRRNL